MARGYARVLDRAADQAWAVRWIGPLYLAALEELIATPMARSRLRKDTGPRRPSQLDRLRAARSGTRP